MDVVQFLSSERDATAAEAFASSHATERALHAQAGDDECRHLGVLCKEAV